MARPTHSYAVRPPASERTWLTQGELTRSSVGGADCGLNFKRPSPSLDFAQSLETIRTVLHRDLAAFERSAGIAQAAVIVLFAIEPPLADAVTTKEYEQLANLACLIWVVPEAMRDLLSPVFATGGTIFADHPGVGEEVISLLEISVAPDPTVRERRGRHRLKSSG